MNARNLIVPALLLLLADSIGCEEDDRNSFGEPCAPEVCDEGLSCYAGYCEEECVEDSDCQPIDGWKHECHAGQCQIACDDQGACPQTLATPLECITEWCAATKPD
ncbi:hypothetical protein [Nannocystis bainbridge]|uniref:Uncharacterized protein n=1 Tax=Nannocystis bainbridge TaxID=2995303 RepID=A0ABT5E788_9BACT|nr:hypothetical protein [Nannocystis bainbridge]MDC0721724.1 hypothetical protein [Nannocystis bainbridge]